VSALRARVHRLPGGRIAWRVAIAILGLLIVVAGVILLPLPGPGWLIIFVGLGVWAMEFAWAERLLSRARRFVRRWTAWVLGRPRWVQLLIGGAGLVLVVGAAVGSWLWYRGN
jgi:uncharacterized protein (TIGR02611 family)